MNKNTKNFFNDDIDIASATKNVLQKNEGNKGSNNDKLSLKITNQKLHVAVDGRGLTYPSNLYRGIGHYTLNLLKAIIAKHLDEVQLTLYFDDAIKLEEIRKVINIDKSIEFKHYPLTSSLTEDVFFVPDSMGIFDGYDSPFNLKVGIPISILVHDFTPVNYRPYFDEWPLDFKQNYLGRMQEIRHNRPQILTNSEFTKKDCIKHLGVPEQSITAIMAGLNDANAIQNHTEEETESVLKKFKIQSPFFLSVGGCDKHKNTELSILSTINLQTAFLNERKNITPQLVIIGDLKDPFKIAYKRMLESKGFLNFIFTGYVTQKELGCMYSKATALLYPSLWEGFGFPVLEAMANKCPVITSKRTSLPEVGGDSVYYVNDLNQEEITKAMKELIENDNLRNELKEKGFERSKLFSWDKTAQRAISAWKELARK